MNVRRLSPALPFLALLVIACSSRISTPEELRAGLRSDFEQRQAVINGSQAETVRTISTTLGSGVRRRVRCVEEAAFEGAWPEGASVTIVQTGGGDCAGWLWVTGAGASGWVRSEFLR